MGHMRSQPDEIGPPPSRGGCHEIGLNNLATPPLFFHLLPRRREPNGVCPVNQIK